MLGITAEGVEVPNFAGEVGDSFPEECTRDGEQTTPLSGLDTRVLAHTVCHPL